MKRKILLVVAAGIVAASMTTSPAFASARTAPAARPMFAASASAATTLTECVNKFQTKATKYYNSYGFSSNRYAYTAAELKMLAVVIYREAKSEPYACKVAIGNVVMNRVLAPGYPGATIKEVVTRPNQFSYSASTQPNAECIKAATDVLKYELWVVPQNTYFFKSSSSTANWGRHTFYKRIGHTAFYRDSNYKGRYNGTAIPGKLYQRVYKWPQYGCTVSRNVRKIQTMLTKLGFKTTADGWFGASTKDALVKFQKKYGLTADGIAGPATLKKLISKYGLSSYLKLK
jgi:spore germination cell wall hydrolase CwlJ-like protein